MSKIASHNRDYGFGPQPRFATDAGIRLAERLRRQLEEKYIGRAAAGTPRPTNRGKLG